MQFCATKTSDEDFFENAKIQPCLLANYSNNLKNYHNFAF